MSLVFRCAVLNVSLFFAGVLVVVSCMWYVVVSVFLMSVGEVFQAVIVLYRGLFLYFSCVCLGIFSVSFSADLRLIEDRCFRYC